MRGESKFLKVLLIAVLSGLICASMLALAPAGEVKASCGQTWWYFAEGCTGGDFDTFILIQNPNATDAIAHLRFFTPNGVPITWDVDMAGESRQSINLEGIPGLENQEVATEVVCEGEGIIAERAMYFNYDSGAGDRAGGHSTIGADGLSCSWYLPEGYTGGNFDTFVLLMNPGDTDANVWLKLMKPNDGRYYPFQTVVPAGRRKTVQLDGLVWVDGGENVIADLGAATGGGTEEPAVEVRFDDTDVSTWVYADRDVMAEMAMYYDYYGKAGGSSSIGARYASQEWYLPEGFTVGGFDTYITAMNPNGCPVDITYTFFSNLPGVAPREVVHPGIPAYSRDTISVDAVEGLEGAEVSTKVTAVRRVQLAGVEENPVDRYAVLFGVEDYPTGDDVLYSVDDMYDIKHRLYDYGGFDYHYCEGADATLANFDYKMDWLASTADANDVVVVFFGGRSSFVGVDGSLDLYDGSVSTAQLEAYFAALQTENLVGLFSCNSSGTIAGDLAAPGRLLMASCSDGETSYEFPETDFAAATGTTDYGNGAWAYYFVEALAEKDADSDLSGRVSAQEAHAYLAPRVTALVNGKEAASQVPEIYDGIGDVDLTVDKVAASVVAQRSVYFDYKGASDGATSIGATGTLPNWFLAEGYTGGSFDTFVCVMNPYGYPQKLTITYMTPNGEPIVVEDRIEANSRKTIPVDAVPGLEDMDVSTRVSASAVDTAAAGYGGGIVVERAMYFDYCGKTGGSCSIGYGSW